MHWSGSESHDFIVRFVYTLATAMVFLDYLMTGMIFGIQNFYFILFFLQGFTFGYHIYLTY